MKAVEKLLGFTRSEQSSPLNKAAFNKEYTGGIFDSKEITKNPMLQNTSKQTVEDFYPDGTLRHKLTVDDENGTSFETDYNQEGKPTRTKSTKEFPTSIGGSYKEWSQTDYEYKPNGDTIERYSRGRDNMQYAVYIAPQKTTADGQRFIWDNMNQDWEEIPSGEKYRTPGTSLNLEA